MSTINKYTGKFRDQHWLVAHNAWNTEQAAGLANQKFNIADLLDYGVRGLALDIYGSDEDSLYLSHGGATTTWSKVRDELNHWLAAHPNEIVTLFFESYLTGPEKGKSATGTAR